jgi:hypothetical protein
MKLFLSLLALLAIVAGSLFLLPILAWASLQDPRLVAADYYAAVVTTLFSTGATLAGVSVVVLGVAAGLYVVLLAGRDRQERKAALPYFWAALGVGTVAVFALLLFVNYLALQAGEVAPISRWLWR